MSPQHPWISYSSTDTRSCPTCLGPYMYLEQAIEHQPGCPVANPRCPVLSYLDYCNDDVDVWDCHS